MAQRKPVAMTAAVGFAIGLLLAAGPAMAQSWQSETLPNGGARASVQSGAASFALECTPGAQWPVLTVVYRPSTIGAVNLQPTAFGGQGEVGDGFTTGYLFFNFDDAAVQQFMRRDSQRGAFVTTSVGDVLLQRLRSDNRLLVTPFVVPDTVFDRFSLRGSSRSIGAALEICTNPPPPPQPPANVATAPPDQPPLPPAPDEGTISTPPDQPALPPAPDDGIGSAPPDQPPLPPAPGEGHIPETATTDAPPLPELPGTAPPAETSPPTSGPRIVGEAGDFVAMAEGPVCARVLTIAIMAPQAAAFETETAVLQQLISQVQGTVTADCPEVEILRVAGYVGDTQVYDGIAARSTLWTLVAVALPGDFADGTATPAAPPTSPDGPPEVATAPDLPTSPELPASPEVPAAPEAPPAPDAEATPEVASAPPQVAPPAPEETAEPPAVSSLFGRPQPQPAPAQGDADTPGTSAAIACPGPDAAGFAEPAGDVSPLSTDSLTWSDAGETVLLSPALGASLYDTMAGDDVIYVYGQHAGAEVIGGQGADTIVICAMDDISLVVMPGYAGGGDAEPDTLIVEPEVLLGVPEGFLREIRVFGFSQPADRLVLRLPTSVGDPVIEEGVGGASVQISVGQVRIKLVTLDTGLLGQFDPSGVEVQRVEPPEGPTEPVASAPAGTPGAGISCPASPDPAQYAAPEDAHGDSYAYGREDDEVLVQQEVGVFAHYAEAGDDLVYVFGGNAGMHVNLGPGNDTLVYCALNEVSYSAAGGDELSSFDADTDVIIFEPGAFRNIPEGFQRGFFLYSISPINDRVVVRLPPDLEAELVDFEAGFPKILVGDNVVIQLSPTTEEVSQAIDPAMVIIERVPG